MPEELYLRTATKRRLFLEGVAEYQEVLKTMVDTLGDEFPKEEAILAAHAALRDTYVMTLVEVCLLEKTALAVNVAGKLAAHYAAGPDQHPLTIWARAQITAAEVADKKVESKPN
jgi:hypothetical protein